MMSERVAGWLTDGSKRAPGGEDAGARRQAEPLRHSTVALTISVTFDHTLTHRKALTVHGSQMVFTISTFPARGF